MKITLIGDSVFDNKVYVGKEKSTIEHLQDLLPHHTCELLAVDGSITEGVINSQLPKLDGSDYVFVSSGGNDALKNSGVLHNGFDESSPSLLRMSQIGFHYKYGKLIEKLKEKGIPFSVFTIYSGNFMIAKHIENDDRKEIQQMADVLISIYNDIIYRICYKYSVPLIENRDLFTESEDYANEIEPSSQGSLKMARAMVEALKVRGL